MKTLLSDLLRREGAVAYGVAPAGPVDAEDWHRFDAWLSKGYNAGMDYMGRYLEVRRDPRLLLGYVSGVNTDLRGDAKSLISVAFNYRQPNPFQGVATYALGQDYHKVLRRRLKKVVSALSAEFGGRWRICIDSAPVLERFWAVKCGVGERSGFHGNIVVPGVGSMVFLAELVTDLEVPPHSVNFMSGAVSVSPSDDAVDVRPSRSVCPTGALLEGGLLDSRRCINYLTIEHKEPLTAAERRLVGAAVFGCDVCQRVCAENRGVAPEVLPEFKPMQGLASLLEGEAGSFDLSRSPLSRSRNLQGNYSANR